MTYTVQKQNLGSQRTFKTQAALTRAIKRAGADAVQFNADGSIGVRWDEQTVFTYPVDKNGNVDYQLAWDMET